MTDNRAHPDRCSDEEPSQFSAHASRGFGADPFAPACGCALAPCGLVDMDAVDPECRQHPIQRCKRIRVAHSAADCPGAQA